MKLQTPFFSLCFPDGCLMENTTLITSSGHLLSFQWSEVAIGITTMYQCPCNVYGCDLVTVPRTASRLCGGNIVSGGRWDQPSDSRCRFSKLEATRITHLVCFGCVSNSLALWKYVDNVNTLLKNALQATHFEHVVLPYSSANCDRRYCHCHCWKACDPHILHQWGLSSRLPEQHHLAV